MIALHAVAITALALSKIEVDPYVFTITKVRSIPLPKDPPETRADPKPLPKQPAQTATRAETVIKLPPLPDNGLSGTITPPRPPVLDGPVIPENPPARPADPPKPVRMAAVIDSRSELQPSYPASEQRAGTEGSATVRVLVGADGRVKAVEKVSATSEGFFRATERQARLHWRFKPATLDGRPIESWQVMTVHFELTA